MSGSTYAILGVIVAVCIIVRLSVMVYKAMRGDKSMRRAMDAIGGSIKREDKSEADMAQDEDFVREISGLRAIDEVLIRKESICDEKGVSATIEVEDIPLNVELDDLKDLYELLIDDAIYETVNSTDDGGWISIGTGKTYANWTLMIMFGRDAEIGQTNKVNHQAAGYLAAEELVDLYSGYINKELSSNKGKIFVEISLTSVKQVPEDEE